MRRTNAQWPEIFNQIEGLKSKPVTTAHELQWATDEAQLDAWKEQLYDALESYTAGAARKLVEKVGEARVLDC